MELLILLIALAIVLGIADVIMYYFWVSFYYRYGVPLFRKSVKVSDCLSICAEELEEEYNYINSNSYIPHEPVMFYELSSNEIAFRVDFFFRCSIPVIHGLVRIDEHEQTVSVTGYANWYVFPLLAIIAYADFLVVAHSGASHILPALVVASVISVVLMCFYTVQFYRCKRILRVLEGAF